MTKEEKIICKMYLEEMGKDKDCNEYKLLMQMLEQPTSDDCISRQAVIEYIEACGAELGHDIENESVREDILNMPPVTPTHGTCDNCHYSLEKNNFQICTKYHETVKRHGFYCADYEKRGNSDGSN